MPKPDLYAQFTGPEFISYADARAFENSIKTPRSRILASQDLERAVTTVDKALYNCFVKYYNSRPPQFY